ncbi:MAG: hypothetical protein JO101_00300 [Candidatus Eremiobacteraeota bacterium]|nr:hypothetical protein [Candidatus Eremiobacteraeota bacterium]MBV8353733.1 hypothetical protein [Candidatus Eremiobacteraeota bacterium]
MRTFTAPAVLILTRGPQIAGIAFALGALLEYVGDLFPRTPSRTRPLSLTARLLSGAFVGWLAAVAFGAPQPAGAICGVAGALVGTYGGLAFRLTWTARIGAVPAALLEDAIAIGIAVYAAFRIRV